MALYGSITNRLEENKIYGEEIKVGTGATQYLYSDREPWEVIEVISQDEFVLRELDSKRVDKNGMSECQDYEFFSNEKNRTVHLYAKKDRKGHKHWYEVELINLEYLDGLDQWASANILFNLTETRRKKVLAGKTVRIEKRSSYGWSIGRADKYYDYSF